MRELVSVARLDVIPGFNIDRVGARKAATIPTSAARGELLALSR
jgi:hypothetical protein